MKANWRLLKITVPFMMAWLFVQLAAPSGAFTQQPVTPLEAMRVANEDYEAGNYTDAVSIYEAIIDSGLHHSSVYYNLGNAYFKQEDLGRAILNYRRAQRLDPRDADTTANLSIARAQTVDKLELPVESGLSNLVQLAEEWLTLSEALLLALVLWLIIGVLAVVMLLRPMWRRWSGISMGVLVIFLLVGLISIANRYYLEQNYPPAVIVAEQVDVTSGPGSSEQYLVEFTLHSGAEVRLLENRSGWQRISLPGDLQGWVPDNTVERVNE